MERSDWAWAARRGWRRSRRHEAHTPMVLVRSGKCFLHLIYYVLFKIRYRFGLLYYYAPKQWCRCEREREIERGDLTDNLKGEALSCSCKNKYRKSKKGCLVRVSQRERIGKMGIREKGREREGVRI